MYCENCGHKLHANSNFCEKCGSACQKEVAKTTEKNETLTEPIFKDAEKEENLITKVEITNSNEYGEFGIASKIWFWICIISYSINIISNVSLGILCYRTTQQVTSLIIAYFVPIALIFSIVGYVTILTTRKKRNFNYILLGNIAFPIISCFLTTLPLMLLSRFTLLIDLLITYLILKNNEKNKKNTNHPRKDTVNLNISIITIIIVIIILTIGIITSNYNNLNLSIDTTFWQTNSRTELSPYLNNASESNLEKLGLYYSAGVYINDDLSINTFVDLDTNKINLLTITNTNKYSLYGIDCSMSKREILKSIPSYFIFVKDENNILSYVLENTKNIFEVEFLPDGTVKAIYYMADAYENDYDYSEPLDDDYYYWEQYTGLTASDIITYCNTSPCMYYPENNPHYETYYNYDFDFKIDYPSHFIIEETNNSTCMLKASTSDDSASVKICASYNDGTITPKQMQDEFNHLYDGEITYSPLGNDWFAIQIDNDIDYHYAYYKVRNDVIRGFEFHFTDRENLKTYQGYIDHIYASLEKIVVYG